MIDTMKKRFLALALAGAAFCGVQAQTESMIAFKHVGVGFEVGLMGAGVQVSMPVVSQHLVLSVGYNFGAFGKDVFSKDLSIDKATANEGIDRLNEEIVKHNNKEGVKTQFDQVERFDRDVNINTGLSMGNHGKVMLEYYPKATSRFHLTAGLIFGNKAIFSLKGEADDRVQGIYNRAMDAQRQLQEDGDISRNDDFVTEKLSYNIRNHTYAIKNTPGAKDNVKAELNIEAASVRPYLGLGWGRSVPKKRVGFQFELGAWYHGKVDLGSPNEVAYNKDIENNEDIDDIVKTVKKVAFYPQLTFRLTGKIF